MYTNPVEVIKTNSWEESCKISQQKYRIQNPIVITSRGTFERQNLSSIFRFESIHSDISPDPTFESCQKAIDLLAESKYDGIIAIGGGSVMDTAKVVMAAVGTNITDLNELLVFNNKYDFIMPSIFIPTTHGTGSEVTKWGTIWNKKENRKYSISHESLYPSVAILDGNLTLTLPLDISIITSMDALSHSFEAIWNKNKNDKSTEYAISAICSIIKNIYSLKLNPLDLSIRNKLLEASNIAGLAFSNTKTAAAHSISYPLTLNYNIPHGIASSISLAPLLKINKGEIIYEIKEILFNLKLSTINELITTIKDIPKEIIEFKLRSWGVNKKEIPSLVKQSFTKERMENNIVKILENDVEKILYEIY
jgi:alcohol dehydrogenase class IV